MNCPFFSYFFLFFSQRGKIDAMAVARNVLFDPRLVPGGGAIEMTCSQYLNQKAGSVEGVQQWIYKSVASALEVIPRTLIQNSGAKVVELLTELRVNNDPFKLSIFFFSQSFFCFFAVLGETCGRFGKELDLGH
jgi:hypothetical protein